jgi:hypothetical protein
MVQSNILLVRFIPPYETPSSGNATAWFAGEQAFLIAKSGPAAMQQAIAIVRKRAQCE